MRTYQSLPGAHGYLFSWRASYLCTIWFDVLSPAGERSTLELRTRLSDYEASIYNGGRDAYRREQEPLVGVLRFEHSCDRPMPLQLVEAFNAWRLADHEGFLAHLRADPERYGEEAGWALDVVTPPRPVRCGAHYDTTDGRWRFNSETGGDTLPLARRLSAADQGHRPPVAASTA